MPLELLLQVQFHVHLLVQNVKLIMSFDSILISFATYRSAPLGAVIKDCTKEYYFAPLCHDESIYTADYNIWSDLKEKNSRNIELYSFCPTVESITKILQEINTSSRVVLALTEFNTFEPPGSVDVHLPLVRIQEIMKQSDIDNLVDAGFDVVDKWTGLSALANIGYSKDDVTNLNSFSYKTNQFGLLTSVIEANKFVEFASSAAPEHMPFIPLKILVCESA